MQAIRLNSCKNNLIVMEWKVIKSEKDYQKALKRLEQIFDATRNSKAGDELELLSLLIDNYEQEKTPDFLLGQMMDAEKTGTTVSRAKIMNKLKPK